jgi:hypothetical protein
MHLFQKASDAKNAVASPMGGAVSGVSPLADFRLAAGIVFQIKTDAEHTRDLELTFTIGTPPDEAVVNETGEDISRSLTMEVAVLTSVIIFIPFGTEGNSGIEDAAAQLGRNAAVDAAPEPFAYSISGFPAGEPNADWTVIARLMVPGSDALDWTLRTLVPYGLI